MKAKQSIASQAVKAFLTESVEKTKNFGNYKLLPNGQLVYRSVVTREIDFKCGQSKKLVRLLEAILKGDVVLESPSVERLRNDLKELKAEEAKTEGQRTWSTFASARIRYLGQELIAQKIQTGPTLMPLGNSSVLNLVERRVAFGREVRKYGERIQSEVQRLLSEKIPMIPFVVFEQASLDPAKLKMIEQGEAETVKRKVRKYNEKKRDYEDVLEPMHFTGACLFSIESKFFLFDIDRREVKHGIFNPFLVELPGKASTIREAYDLLKPESVKQAESKGLKVLRQGEWFFIEEKKQKNIEMEFQSFRASNKQRNGRNIERFELRAGRNRPNTVKQGFQNAKGEVYVKGIVEHSGREHAPLKLSGWHKVQVNTSRNSFTIVGDVD